MTLNVTLSGTKRSRCFSSPDYRCEIKGIVSPALAPRVKFLGEGSTALAGRGVNQNVGKSDGHPSCYPLIRGE